MKRMLLAAAVSLMASNASMAAAIGPCRSQSSGAPFREPAIEFAVRNEFAPATLSTRGVVVRSRKAYSIIPMD
jgi:hypothetical protein